MLRDWSVNYLLRSYRECNWVPWYWSWNEPLLWSANVETRIEDALPVLVSSSQRLFWVFMSLSLMLFFWWRCGKRMRVARTWRSCQFGSFLWSGSSHICLPRLCVWLRWSGTSLLTCSTLNSYSLFLYKHCNLFKSESRKVNVNIASLISNEIQQIFKKPSRK